MGVDWSVAEVQTMRTLDETVGSRAGLEWRCHQPAREIERQTPIETAIGLSFDGRPHTVLMATPGDVEDLARGFTVTEAIAAFDEILGIDIESTPQGILANVRLSANSARRRARPRTLEGRSSCGLCGVQRLADAVRVLPVVGQGQTFSPQAVQRAVAAMADHQVLGRATRATHAAGFADARGEVSLVREDVGRHSALDKLAGGLLAVRTDIAAGFIVVTSRCSFEMVEKVARIGCPMIVAVSAPTDLAISKAEQAGVTLVALAREDGHTVFSCSQRLGLWPITTETQAA